jgi:hypothetical protein
MPVLKGRNHFQRFERLSRAHWELVVDYRSGQSGRGLPNAPRALALRAAAQRIWKHREEWLNAK